MSITDFIKQKGTSRFNKPWRSDTEQLNMALVVGTYLYTLLWLYQSAPKLTWQFFILAVLFSASTYYRFSDRWEYHSELHYHLHIYIDIALATGISIVTHTYASLPVLFALTALGVGGTSRVQSMGALGLSIGGLLWINQQNTGLTNMFENIGNSAGNLFNLFIVVGYARIINELYMQRSLLKRQKQQLNAKHEELELAYDALNQSVLEREALAAEQERHRMSGELHDHMGHAMASSLIQLQYIQKVMTKDVNIAQEKLTQTYAHLNQSYEEVRQFVRQSQVTMTPGTGLEQLRKRIEDLGQYIQLEIAIQIDSSLSQWQLEASQETHLLRIIQESMTNSLKHGHATCFQVRMSKEMSSVVKLILQDDGQGSDGLETGYGLGSLKRRAAMLGGCISFETQAGKGFKTVLEMPQQIHEQEQAI